MGAAPKVDGEPCAADGVGFVSREDTMGSRSRSKAWAAWAALRAIAPPAAIGAERRSLAQGALACDLGEALTTCLGGWSYARMGV